jgi:hypothetical protein
MPPKSRREEAAAAAKRRSEEETAAQRRQEEEVAQKRIAEEAAAKTRARHLTKALKQCQKVKPGHRRSRCRARAKKKFGPRPIARASRSAIVVEPAT